MNITTDDWLSGIIGKNVYRINLSQCVEDSKDLDPLLNHIEHYSPAMYFTKVPTDQIAYIHKMSKLGFGIVDVNVTFKRNPAPVEYTGRTSIDLVMNASDQYKNSILKIAETSFVYSRFHLDPNILNQTANNIKRRWVESYIDGVRGEHLIVAMVDGNPAGFLAVMASEWEGSSSRVVDLIAVDNCYRRLGVGKALLEGFNDMYVGVCDYLVVGTQIANAPSIRLYERSGFLLDKTSYVLHGHFGEE